MTIKFTSGAGNHIKIADSALTTLPDSDWTLAFAVTLNSTLDATGGQYIFSGGSYGATSALSLLLGAGDVQVFYEGQGPTLSRSFTRVAGATYIVVVQRSAGVIRTKICPAQTAMPTTGDAVLTTTTTLPIAKALDLPGNGGFLTIGDRDNDRPFNNSMSRALCIHEALSDLDIAKLAHGMQITDLGKTPVWYIRMNDGSDTADIGPNAINTVRSSGASPMPVGGAANWAYVTTARPPVVEAPTINGTPQAGTSCTATLGAIDASPAPTIAYQWLVDGTNATGAGATSSSYTPASTDVGKALTVRVTASNSEGNGSATSAAKTVMAATVAVTFTGPLNETVFQRIDGARPVAIAGTYSGEQPAKIEYRLLDSDGTTERKTWTDAVATIPAGGTWSASPSIPQGATKYRMQVRAVRANASVIATSDVAANRFGVGDLIGMIGSSSAGSWAYPNSSGTFDGTRSSQCDDGNWQGTTQTYALRMATYIAQQTGVVVGMISGGYGGTSLIDWAITNRLNCWGRFADFVTANGGKLAGVFVSVGSNDAAGSNGITSQASHLSNLNTLFNKVRTLTGQSTLPVLIGGYNRRTTYDQAMTQVRFDLQSDWARSAENEAGDQANVYSVQTLDFPIHGDGVHLVDYSAMTARMSYVWAEAMQGRYRRGPKITAFKYSNNTLFVDFVHRSGTDVTPQTGGTGWTVTDANGAPSIVSSQRVSATRYSVTFNRNLVEPVTAKFLRGGAPEWSAPIMDNGSIPLPMTTETTLSATADAGSVVVVSKDLSANYSIDAPAPSYVRSDLQAIYGIGSVVVTVAANRVAKFAGRKRVVKFEATDPAYRGGKWYVSKGINDELFYAGDISKQLADSGTTAVSVSAIAVGVTAISPPTLQGSVVVVKIGGFNIASDNYVTLRIVCENGERFDRTIIFERANDDVVYKKDPDDQLFYAADVSEMLTSGVTTAVSFETIVAGVTKLSSLSVQGVVMPALIGGFDIATGVSNFATFRVTCANGERFDKTIRFEREET